MKIVELIRLEEAFEGTFGILRIQKKMFCCTLEPKDRENKVNVSSIPCQQYLCRRKTSEKFGDTFQVMNVPGRTGVVFHSGNYEHHTSGCILLGKTVFEGRNGRMVTDSKDTIASFLHAEMKNDDLFHLTIYEYF